MLYIAAAILRLPPGERRTIAALLRLPDVGRAELAVALQLADIEDEALAALIDDRGAAVTPAAPKAGSRDGATRKTAARNIVGNEHRRGGNGSC